MKTIKLSLNALVAMCCLMLFMTSCQDDAVENELEPIQNAESTSKISDSDNALQLSRSAARRSLGQEIISSPVYELAITIPTDTNEFFTINGTLALAPPPRGSSNSLEGTFTFVNDSGEEVVVNTGAASAFGSERDLTVILDFEEIPPVNEVIAFNVSNVAFERVQGVDTFVETGTSLFSSGSLEDITFVGRLIEEGEIAPPSSFPSYELAITIPTDTNEFFTKNGTLALAPSSRGSNLEGTFTFVNDSGEEVVAGAGAFSSASSERDVTVLINFEEIPPIGEIIAFDVSNVAFEREQGVDTFVETGGSFFDTGSLEDITFVGRLIEDPS